MNETKINFNGNEYLATYNKQSGYYEVELEAPDIGGVLTADVRFVDFFGQTFNSSKDIQFLAKEKLNIETNHVFMWIFDYKDFSLKDIIEISDYELKIDEETNATSNIKVLKKTTAKSKDIIAIKRNSEVIYWGIIDNIQNKEGKPLYEYTLKYITNMFREKVCLNKNVEDTELKEGTYIIKSGLDLDKVIDVTGAGTEDETNVQLYARNNSDSQKFKFTKTDDGYYKMEALHSGKVLDVYAGSQQNGANVDQYTWNGSDAQKWTVKYVGNGYYNLISKCNGHYLDVEGGISSSGTNIRTVTNNNSLAQKFYLEKVDEQLIKEKGIEDYLAKTIEDNFIKSSDEFLNKKYLEVRVKTHTKLQTKVTNVQDNLYYLNTFMTNCTQLYNINYNFFVEGKKLILEIDKKSQGKELIDIKAQAISNYTEVFETDVVSKVEVLTDTITYCLYLLNDRTTTTDASNKNRAEGKTERVYTQNIVDANQKALDTIQANKYNHMITFSMYEKMIKVGTPIAIKTKESVILDTYISAIKITPEKFIEYTCGNIRVRLIDKLLKERK